MAGWRERGWKTHLLAVRDVEAAVDGALKRTEDAVARGRANQADVQHAGEWPRITLLLNEEHLAIRLGHALVGLVHSQLLQQTARA